MEIRSNTVATPVQVQLSKAIASDKTAGIMTYGKDNDYPQAIEKLIFGSQTGKACSNILARFIAGEFEDKELEKVVVGKDKNGKDLTLKKYINIGAENLARFNGLYTHLEYKVTGEVASISVVPFRNCRFQKEDDKGFCGKIGVHKNWAKEKGLPLPKKTEVSWYNVYNVDAFEANVKDAGGFEKFKGQISYLFFDDTYLYPLSPFDSVALDLDTEYQVQLFKNTEVRQGMSGKNIFYVPEFDNDDDFEDFEKKVNDFSGPNGAKALVIETKFSDLGQIKEGNNFLVKDLPANINDKLFENWEKSLSNNIRKGAQAMPAVLIDYEQGNLSTVTGEALVQAQEYYNIMTQFYRDAFTDMLKDMFKNSTNERLRNANFKINKVNTYGTINVPAATEYKANS